VTVNRVRTVPPSLLRWAFHTPLRLAGVCMAVAAIAVGGMLVATSSSDRVPTEPRRPGVQPAPAPSTTAIPSPSPTPSESVNADARREARNAARTFVDAWAVEVRPPPRAKWLDAIEPLTTDSLFRGLRVTDPARLPEGQTTSVVLTEIGAFSSAATVTLTDGLRVGVRMVLDGGRWVVADVRPADT
jgi:hypothetical protein